MRTEGARDSGLGARDSRRALSFRVRVQRTNYCFINRRFSSIQHLGPRRGKNCAVAARRVFQKVRCMESGRIVCFRDLEVWNAAMDLVIAVYGIARRLPASERFELARQIRRSVTSVPSNIAEGHAHRGGRTYLRHVRIALGSLAELETQLELTVRLAFTTTDDVRTAFAQVRRTGQLLHGLERSLKRRAIHRGLSGLAILCTVVALGVLAFQ